MPILIALCAAALALQQPSTAAPSLETLRARIEHLHDHPTAPVRGVRLRRPDDVVHFLERRAFAAVWKLPEAAQQIRGAIAGIAADGLTPAHYHLTAIDTLLQTRAATPDRTADEDLQILLTDAVAALLDEVRYGRVAPASLDRRWNVDPRAGAPPLDSLLERAAGAADPAAAIEALKPTHFIYTGLKAALAQLGRAAATGGWPTVPAGPALKPGTSDARIPAVRRRLEATGELPPGAASDSAQYDEPLVAAVRAFQDHHRLTTDGVIGPATIAEMNVQAATRAEQVRANLERVRWVVGGLQDSFVLVNLPAFKAYLIRNRRNIWEARTQIGREARQTPAFRADLKYIVFNPDWTVPPTILAKDVLAGMRRGENTIARKHLTILDRQGRAVDSAAIDWSTASARNFPYVLRQPPGAGNALGRVKFIFPNEHAIFLHDTPSQELFTPDTRTFSSGCIRVEGALELAATLLSPQGWTPERVAETIGKGSTETVFLEQPLPVLIVYWTASVGASGQLRFARDVYARDAAVLRALGR